MLTDLVFVWQKMKAVFILITNRSFGHSLEHEHGSDDHSYTVNGNKNHQHTQSKR